MARHAIPLLFAILFPLLATSIGAPPAWAATLHYKAEPSAPPPAGSLIVREAVWKCSATACSAPQGTSRPAVECGALARRLGTLRSFAAGGRAFDAEELEKCNARAR